MNNLKDQLGRYQCSFRDKGFETDFEEEEISYIEPKVVEKEVPSTPKVFEKELAEPERLLD